MVSSFAFGSYVPVRSVIHALNAQVKIILACAFSICIFFIDTWAGMLVALVATIALYAAARVSVRHALRGLLPIVFILVFTVIVHAFSFGLGAQTAAANASCAAWPGAQPFFAAGDCQYPLVGTFGFTCSGLLTGAFIALRIALLVSACALLTFTTTETELVDALRRFLSPLRAVKVPADQIAMVVTLALRFVPLVVVEAYGVRDAQRARGADFEAASVMARTRAWIPVFVPLFVRLFKRASDLGNALDARCFGVRPRASSGKHWCIADCVVLVCVLAAVVVLAVIL